MVRGEGIEEREREDNCDISPFFLFFLLEGLVIELLGWKGRFLLACVYVLIPRGLTLISKFMADKPGISGVRLKLTRRILRSRLIISVAVFLSSAKGVQ